MDEQLIRREALARILKARGMTASDLARLSGGQPSYYYDLLRGAKSFGERAARNIEVLLDLVRGELDALGNGAAPNLRGEVPIYDWKAAVHHKDGGGQQQLLCPVMHSKETFAVQVVGDSMDAGSGRRYPAGTMVYIDPCVEASDGRAVLAVIDGAAEPTLKIFRNSDGQRWLQPLHPQYPAIHAPFKVIGTVIGSFIPET